MPYLYAIRHIETVTDEYGKPRKQNVFDEVEQSIAEANEEGCWKVVTRTGVSLTPWQIFNERAAKKIKYGPENDVFVDVLGQTIRVREYVMATYMHYKDLCLCEVVSFTPQRIRIRYLNGGAAGDSGYTVTLKNPSDIIRIDQSLI